MNAVHVLFEPTGEVLGELLTHEGAFVTMTLRPDGQEVLEPYMKDWQTRGIPVLRDVPVTKEGRTSIVFYQERLPLRDGTFLWAFMRWAEGRRWVVVTLQTPAFECWERLLQLPLEPRERFTMILVLRNQAESDLRRWQEALDEAIRAVKLSDEHAHRKLETLRSKTAEGFMKKMAGTSV